jgi:hypothetical protein
MFFVVIRFSVFGYGVSAWTEGSSAGAEAAVRAASWSTITFFPTAPTIW